MKAFIASVALIVLAPLVTDAEDSREADSLKGTWVALSKFDDDGKVVPIAAEEHFRLSLGDNVLSMRSPRITFEARYQLDPRQMPKAIDVSRVVRGKPTTFRGIYEIRGDRLRLCLAGSRADRPTAFKHGDDIEIAVELGRQK
jgi:uncharacterized protein (TIGR03067 family)